MTKSKKCDNIVLKTRYNNICDEFQIKGIRKISKALMVCAA